MTNNAVPLAIAAGILFVSMAVHKVDEGYVGVYYRGGALLDGYSEAGYNVMMPGLTRMEQVQVTTQTDEVVNIPCGTRGGVLISFDKVEVVNMLDKSHVISTVRRYGVHYDKLWIFDKLHHTINQWCSGNTLQEVYIDKFEDVDDRIKDSLQEDCLKYDTGISILAVRLTKPRIPEVVRKNYEEMEAQKTQLMIAIERQRVVEKEEETERKRAVISAQRKAEVSAIAKQQEIAEQEAAQNVSAIKDAMHLAKERAVADANAYRLKMEAEANAALLTPQYLELVRAQAVANNTKVYFGNSIPTMFSAAVGDGKR